MRVNIPKHPCSLLTKYWTTLTYLGHVFGTDLCPFWLKWRPPAKEVFVSGDSEKYQITFPTSVNHRFIASEELACHINCPLTLQKIIICKILKKNSKDERITYWQLQNWLHKTCLLVELWQIQCNDFAMTKNRHLSEQYSPYLPTAGCFQSYFSRKERKKSPDCMQSPLISSFT